MEAESANPPDRKVIACNYAEGTRVASKGALAYVVPQLGGNLPEHVRLLVRSRGGRWVEKWEQMHRLGNFRLKTLPPEHPRYGDQRLWPDFTVTEAHCEELRRALAIRLEERASRAG